MPDPASAWPAPSDLRLLWWIQTYRDLPKLRPTLARLRALYPESDVVVISDGDPDPAIEPECRRHGARFIAGERLFGVAHGGVPVQRMLDAFLATTADILIKIDPDTHVRRRFSRLPPASDRSVYGTVQAAGEGSGRITSIQGGCIVIPRAAAAAISQSRLLHSDRLKPPAVEWAVNEVLRDRVASGLTSYDWTIGWVCRALGIPSENHPEVFSRYRASIVDTLIERRAAVTHPRFEPKQLLNREYYRPVLHALGLAGPG